MDLTGKLLIAMPGMGDPRFDQSVIYLCKHGPDGAMGLIVNKPSPDVRLADLLQQLDIEVSAGVADRPLHFGGPVETQRGFVLHSSEYVSSLQSLQVAEGFAMTATLDILEDIARGSGPARELLALGYAGWGAGQLESELARNGWLTADADPALVFDEPDTTKWTAALRTLGVEPVMLSSDAGRA